MAIQSARGLIPGLKTGWTGRRLQDWILSGLRRANYVVCDTRETRHDLISLAPELESRSCTVEIPLNYPYAPMSITEATTVLSSLTSGTEFTLGRDRFIFHVGGNQWYKNREGLIRSFAQLCASYPDFVRDHSVKLVMAGKSPTDDMRHLVEKSGLTERILFITDVSNQQLCAFYSLAEVMAYPSLKEGFGWPLIEAQACACPVVTSNRPPMSRLAGPAGLLADPENAADFAEKLYRILSEDLEARGNRKTESLQHSRNYDGPAFLNQMNLVYQTVLDGKSN
jgi:glycosyltransferase involved in cell wall biosynthesis